MCRQPAGHISPLTRNYSRCAGDSQLCGEIVASSAQGVCSTPAGPAVSPELGHLLLECVVLRRSRRIRGWGPFFLLPPDYKPFAPSRCTFAPHSPSSLPKNFKYTTTSVVKGIGRVYIEGRLFFLSVDYTRKGEENQMNHLLDIDSIETRLTNYPVNQFSYAVGFEVAKSQAGANSALRHEDLLFRPRTSNSEKKQKKSSACLACPARPASPAVGRAAPPATGGGSCPTIRLGEETVDPWGGVRDCIPNTQTARLSPVSQPRVPSLIREGQGGFSTLKQPYETESKKKNKNHLKTP